MPRSWTRLSLALLLTGAALTTSRADALPPWPQVATGQDGDCTLEVRGNGKFFLIELRGLAPGERASFHLANADIRPIRYTLVADRNGEFSRYYLPFLWHHRSGEVTVRVEAEDCSVGASFGWTRDREY